jgi:hypothetical protein
MPHARPTLRLIALAGALALVAGVAACGDDGEGSGGKKRKKHRSSSATSSLHPTDATATEEAPSQSQQKGHATITASGALDHAYDTDQVTCDDVTYDGQRTLTYVVSIPATGGAPLFWLTITGGSYSELTSLLNGPNVGAQQGVWHDTEGPRIVTKANGDGVTLDGDLAGQFSEFGTVHLKGEIECS